MINVEAKVELSEKGTEGEGKRKKEGERKEGEDRLIFLRGASIYSSFFLFFKFLPLFYFILLIIIAKTLLNIIDLFIYFLTNGGITKAQ